MDTALFETIVMRHSLCPNVILYNSNALAGEAGEVCNMVKKMRIADLRPEWVTSNLNELPNREHFEKQGVEELSDVLFYLTRCARDMGVTLNQLMEIQAEKLEAQSNKYQRQFLK